MTTEFIDTYVGLAEWLLLLFVPAMAWLTIKSWQLAYRYRPYRLPVIKAIVNTIVGACCSWTAFTVIWRWQVGTTPIEFLPISATSFLLLAIIPFLTTGYLIYLDRDRRTRQEKPDKRDRPRIL